MKHFLLTRFHINFQIVSDLWFEERIKIFKNFLFPSVESQNDKDFFWIIKASDQTPQWVRKEMQNYEVDYSPCSGAFGLYPHVFSKIIRKMTNDQEIITTGLDSDDALSIMHIDTVKKYIKPNKFFDFKRGLVKNKDGFFIHEKPKVSQFYSFFDYKKQVPLTVYQKCHMTVGNCIRNQIDYGWIQNNHKFNILNGNKETKKYNIQATKEDLICLSKYFCQKCLSS